MLLKDFIKLTPSYQNISIIKYVHEEYLYTLYDGNVANIPKTIFEYKILKITSSCLNVKGFLDGYIVLYVVQ